MNMRKRSDIDLLRTYYIQKEAQRIKVGPQMEGDRWHNGSNKVQWIGSKTQSVNANKLAMALHLKRFKQEESRLGTVNKKLHLSLLRYCTVFNPQIKYKFMYELYGISVHH
eukprot:803981_1